LRARTKFIDKSNSIKTVIAGDIFGVKGLLSPALSLNEQSGNIPLH
jgi:hypothetical protein